MCYQVTGWKVKALGGGEGGEERDRESEKRRVCTKASVPKSCILFCFAVLYCSVLPYLKRRLLYIWGTRFFWRFCSKKQLQHLHQLKSRVRRITRATTLSVKTRVISFFCLPYARLNGQIGCHGGVMKTRVFTLVFWRGEKKRCRPSTDKASFLLFNLHTHEYEKRYPTWKIFAHISSESSILLLDFAHVAPLNRFADAEVTCGSLHFTLYNVLYSTKQSLYCFFFSFFFFQFREASIM